MFRQKGKTSKARNESYVPRNLHAKVSWRNLWWRLRNDVLACTIQQLEAIVEVEKLSAKWKTIANTQPRVVLDNRVLFDLFSDKMKLLGGGNGSTGGPHGRGWPCMEAWRWRVVVCSLLAFVESGRWWESSVWLRWWRLLLLVEYGIAKGLPVYGWRGGELTWGDGGFMKAWCVDGL